MANGTMKRPLQHISDLFTITAVQGWQSVNSNTTLAYGSLPPTPYRNAIFTVINRGSDAQKAVNVMVDGNDISIYSEKAQNVSIRWHVFGGGKREFASDSYVGCAA